MSLEILNAKIAKMSEIIAEKENELKQELFNLRFQLATGQLEGTARIREVRKQIARIKTALRQEELQK